jgi:hypothetical protein
MKLSEKFDETSTLNSHTVGGFGAVIKVPIGLTIDGFPAMSTACTPNQYRVSGSRVSLTMLAELDVAPSFKYDVMFSYYPLGISYSVFLYSLTSPILKLTLKLFTTCTG